MAIGSSTSVHNRATCDALLAKIMTDLVKRFLGAVSATPKRWPPSQSSTSSNYNDAETVASNRVQSSVTPTTVRFVNRSLERSSPSQAPLSTAAIAISTDDAAESYPILTVTHDAFLYWQSYLRPCSRSSLSIWNQLQQLHDRGFLNLRA